MKMMDTGTSGAPPEDPTGAEAATGGAGPVQSVAPPSAEAAPAAAPAETSMPFADGPAWLANITWTELIVAVVVLVLLVVAVVLLVRWYRKRSESAPRDTAGSLGGRLRSIWGPFYDRIPRRAKHFPTFVVFGEAGVGKSHLIGSRVDWRGQANQFNPSEYEDPLLQLYLGSDEVVHEVSAPLLRDVSSGAKRALARLWHNLGPSVTVLVVLDARTLATTPPAELQALAQLVRGKIGLFPRHVSGSIDVRVCLTHLDQIDGYEEFAAVVGTFHAGLDLALLGPDYTNAEALVSAFDGHSAYALTTRSGEEFSRLVGFYGALTALVHMLPPLLSSLRGDQWSSSKTAPSELYLGSIVPHSYVGDPFEADQEIVVDSIKRYNRRTLAGAVLLGAGCLVALGITLAWHYERISRARQAVERHGCERDGRPGAGPRERQDAQHAARAIDAMAASEVLWLGWVKVEEKAKIADAFEDTIRRKYLEPRLTDEAAGEHGADRIELLYTVSLMYATRDDDLGAYIDANQEWWEQELDLSEEIVTHYLESSTRENRPPAEPLPKIDEQSGREWIEYQERLCAVMKRETGIASPTELAELRERPTLRSKAEYEVLEGARRLLLADDTLFAELQSILGPLDAALAVESRVNLAAISQAMRELTGPLAPSREGAGLATLATELTQIEAWRAGHREASTVVDTVCAAPAGTAVAVAARTQAHDAIEAVLESISDDRKRDGLSFFDQSERLASVGAVRGYGGGATETIPGFYTKAAFEDHVEPVLRFAVDSLPKLELEHEDRERMERALMSAVEAYASAYRDALVTYYLGFEFNPGSKVALPFALKALTQPSSWFTDFLTTVSRNAALTLADDDYHAPLKNALVVLEPLMTLLVESEGTIPGIEPYTATIAGLLPLMDGSAAAAPAEGDGLDARLSGLGLLALQTFQGKEVDRRAQVTEWLDGAQVDYSWHQPFDGPVELIYRYGAQNVEDEVEDAWQAEVRPVVRALLATYPFDGAATEDASVSEIEATLRRQGEPGEFWVRFERLVVPATRLRGDRYVMLDGLVEPMGMLEMVEDVQALSNALWDADGGRIPLKLTVKPKPLPSAPYGGRVASMAYLSAGGSAVYAFNQRPEPQVLELQWWEQGAAVVSLTMTAADGENSRESTIDELDSAFSFYRLLDQGRSCGSKGCRKKTKDELSLTRAAIAKGTRCTRGASRGTTDLAVSWSLPVDDLARVWRLVRFVLVSDPWAPFAVRDCR